MSDSERYIRPSLFCLGKWVVEVRAGEYVDREGWRVDPFAARVTDAMVFMDFEEAEEALALAQLRGWPERPLDRNGEYEQ